MRHLVIALGLLLVWPAAATADSPKLARLKELNAMIAAAMSATPDKLDDAAAVHAAVELQARTVATVTDGLSRDKMGVPPPGPNFGIVQNNLRKVEERLKTMRIVEKLGAVLRRIEPVAAKHGEPNTADLEEAARLLSALNSRKGELPRAHEAMHAWKARIEAKMAEVPWPSGLQPIELSPKILASAFIPVDATVSVHHRAQAIAILNVKAPIRTLQYFGAAFGRADISLRGPVSEVDGLVKGPAKKREWSELEEGLYLVEATSRQPVSFKLVLGSPETPRDRWFAVDTITANAPLEHRRLDAMYPFLGEPKSPIVAQQVFAKAPRELFVYAREDLQANDLRTGPQDLRPRANEPLLVIGSGQNQDAVEVINAQGLSWELRDWKRLAVAPDGAPALPTDVHAFEMSYELDDLRAQPEGLTAAEIKAQAPIRQKYIAAIERWTTCTDKVIAKYGGSVANNMAVVTYRRGKVAKVEHMKDRAWDEADRTCKTKQYEAQTEAFDKQLSKLDKEARARRLEEIRKAWAR